MMDGYDVEMSKECPLCLNIGKFWPAAVTVEEPGGGEPVLPVREGEEDGGEVGDGELLPGGDLQLTEHLQL